LSVQTCRILAKLLKKLAIFMIGKSPNQGQGDFFRPLLMGFIDPKHELIGLANAINWKSIESEFKSYYSNTGTPSKPIRMMVGLLILKQMYNLSDEALIPAWIANPYFQFFCGEAYFQWEQPCDPSDLVHFRNRIGKEGVEKIFSISVHLFSAEVKKKEVVLVDTTVEEKNITFPTDVKLQVKIIEKCVKIAKDEDIKLRQTYTQTLKGLKIKMRFSHHPKRQAEGKKARRKIKIIAGRLVRDLERKLELEIMAKYSSDIELFKKVLSQKRDSKNKIYSLHEPETACIAKGKAHKPYEFGAKVGFAMLPGPNIIVGVETFKGNPHDSQTFEPIIVNTKKITGKSFAKAVVDRGYRGAKPFERTQVILPDNNRTAKSTYQKRVKSALCRKRAAIEPIIGHIKSDCRMARNFLKGTKGDQINAILAATAFNFRQYLNKMCQTIIFWLNLLIGNKQIGLTINLKPSC
jgi:IS5 family transposase